MRLELETRFKNFSIGIINMTDSLPNKRKYWVISDQIIRSSTSVAANFRAAKRARSKKEFIAKLGIALEESDETLFWLQMLKDLKTPNINFEALINEATEITAILVSSVKTSKRNT